VPVIQLLAEYKERHRVTLPAFLDLLTLLQAALPANSLPKTVYKFRKASRAVMKEALGGHGFQALHLCSDVQCTHLYDTEARECPVCAEPRYKRLQNGREIAVRQLRYLDLEQGVRILICRRVSTAIHNFDLPSMVDSTYSVYSPLSEDLFTYFIPRYVSMDQNEARKAKIRFFNRARYVLTLSVHS
jgi:hypothetical protein